MRDRDRRRGVQRIVAARHRQREFVDIGGLPGLTVADQDVETRNAVVQSDVEQADVRLRVLAIGDDAAILDAPDQLLHGRVIEAHHRKAVERQILHEGQESLLDRVEGLEMIEMFRIDIGDDGDVGGQLQKRAVALVRLDDHPVARAAPRIGAIGVDDAAVDDGGIEAGGVEQGRDQRSRRGLAVGAGDRDALLEPHQLGEHLGAPDDGNAPQARRRQLRIVAPDRSGDDDHRGVADLRRVMADEHARATFAQAFDVGVVARVRALHLVTDIEQHLGDAGHADAADADEMNGAELARQFHLHSFPRALSRARHKPICRFGQMGGSPSAGARFDKAPHRVAEGIFS